MKMMKINFKPTIRQIIVAVSALVLFIGSLTAISYLVATWCVTRLPGEPINGACQGNGASTGPDVTQPADGGPPPATPTPEVQAPQVDLPSPWDGASRVNLLIMGLDTQATVDA